MKKEKIRCNKDALEKCEGIAIESIGDAFLGTEGFIQASSALDACKDKHASLANCIMDYNAGKTERDK